MRKEQVCAVAAALLLFAACESTSENKNENDADTVVPDTAVTDQEVVENDPLMSDDVLIDGETDDGTGEDIEVVDEEIIGEETGDEGIADEVADDDAFVDPALNGHLVGFWAMKLELFADAIVPVVNEIVTRTDKIIRMEILEKEGTLYVDWQKAEVCHMETIVTEGSAIAKSITTYFPPKFTANFFYIPPEDLKEPKEQTSVTGAPDNFTFAMNKWYEMRGAYFQGENGTVPFDIETEMIEGPEDPRIFDHDEDGKPGHTFQINSTIASGLVWGVIKNYMEITMVGSGERMEGSVLWGEEEVVIDVDNPLFAGERIVTARETGNTAVAVKIDEAMTCEQILEQKDTLFQP